MPIGNLSVIVVGPGRYFLDAHAPVIEELCAQGKLARVTLVDLPDPGVPAFAKPKYLQLLADFCAKTAAATCALPDDWATSQPTCQNIQHHVAPQLNTAIERPDGVAVIVS